MHAISSAILTIRRNNLFCIVSHYFTKSFYHIQKARIGRSIPSRTTLRWFRSNLTRANIEILHHECPEIESVS